MARSWPWTTSQTWWNLRLKCVASIMDDPWLMYGPSNVLKLNLYLTLLVILSWLEKSANVGLITMNLIEEKLPSGRGYFAVDAKHGSRPWLNYETRWVDLLALFGLFCLIRQTFSDLEFLFGRRVFVARFSYLGLTSSHFTTYALMGYGHHSNLNQTTYFFICFINCVKELSDSWLYPYNRMKWVEDGRNRN